MFAVLCCINRRRQKRSMRVSGDTVSMAGTEEGTVSEIYCLDNSCTNKKNIVTLQTDNASALCKCRVTAEQPSIIKQKQQIYDDN